MITLLLWMMVLAGVVLLGPVMLEVVLTVVVAHRQRDAGMRNRAVGACLVVLVFGGVMLAFPLWLFSQSPG